MILRLIGATPNTTWCIWIDTSKTVTFVWFPSNLMTSNWNLISPLSHVDQKDNPDEASPAGSELGRNETEPGQGNRLL